jgi:hypothetical protein
MLNVDSFLGVRRAGSTSLTMKSMEHGHTIEAPERLSRAVEATGLLDELTG